MAFVVRGNRGQYAGMGMTDIGSDAFNFGKDIALTIGRHWPERVDRYDAAALGLPMGVIKTDANMSLHMLSPSACLRYSCRAWLFCRLLFLV